MSFRVTELQTLLGFAGRSKSGRKHELLGRALALLKCEGNLRVTTKIRDLYNRRNPRKMPMMVNPIPQRQPSRPGPSNVENAGIPVHPDVRLVGLPFFDHIDDLIKPTSLGKSSGFPFAFCSSPSQHFPLVLRICVLHACVSNKASCDVLGLDLLFERTKKAA